MSPVLSGETHSVFRTAAWVQAWIDTWGKHPAVKLIDLGGRSNPLECLYITRQRLKKVIPVNTLCLAGIGCGPISTPRAEYNDFSDLIRLTGSVAEFFNAIKSLAWQQFLITDVLQDSTAGQQIKQLGQQPAVALYTPKSEPAYAVQMISMEEYLQQLGSNTRLAYFNRRKNLAQYGDIHFRDYDINEAEKVFALLNQFHLRRWGQPCYSTDSQAFLKNFGARLVSQGGRFILQSMHINGEAVSVLFDVIWKNTRYNFQSGYVENKYPKIALGAIHMGYGIQDAVENQQVYDFMAGTGKHSDYKKRIATRTQTITNYSLERSFVKKIRQLQRYFT